MGRISVRVLKEPIVTPSQFHKGAILISEVNALVRIFPRLTSLFFVIERRGWRGVPDGEAADVKLVEDSSTLQETRTRFPRAIVLDIGLSDFVDLDCFRPLATPPDYDVIQIACWSRRKRIELFIDAAAMLPELSFVHLGHFESGGNADELDYRAYCLKYAKNRKANITFPFAAISNNDNLPWYKHDINNWINRAKIGVLTTANDGINRFKMECFAANRPVLLCEDVWSPARKHVNERTGLFVEPNAPAVAEGISTMLRNRQRFAPRQYVLENTGNERSLGLLRAALGDICKRPRSFYHFDAIQCDGRNESMAWGEKAIELLSCITRKYAPLLEARTASLSTITDQDAPSRLNDSLASSRDAENGLSSASDHQEKSPLPDRRDEALN